MPLLIERLSKTALVAAIGLFLFIVTLNNLIDYNSNFEFVKHVLSMDSTFPGNTLRWRALTSPWIHHLFYAGIISWEGSSTLAIAYAVFRLWTARNASHEDFQAAKVWVVGALSWNLLLWFVAFTSIGGEWFVMWQSSVWNGQQPAFRMFTSILLVLLFVRMPETLDSKVRP